MYRPSLTLIISGLFVACIIHSIYNISLLFTAPSCEIGERCLYSYLEHNPKLQLHLFISPTSKPVSSEVSSIYSTLNFNYTIPQTIPLKIDIPAKTRQNGTLFLHIIVLPNSPDMSNTFNELLRNPYTVYTRVKMTQFAVPEAETFNLLGEKKTSETSSTKRALFQPITHLRTQITFTIVTDTKEIPVKNIPMEIIPVLRLHDERVFLPIVNYDFLQTRYKSLAKITSENHSMDVQIMYTPISMGKLRLMLHVKSAMEGLKYMGFTDKDVDEVKGIYADTNAYLLAGTVFIASMHILFDFLAFKSDINFWRSKGSFEGLSVSTIVWRAFSQAIIFLYLLDEGSSLLIIIPAGIGTLIELWKTKKVLRLEITRSKGVIPRIRIQKNNKNREMESKTRQFDAESMKYLTYLLYPLVICGAIYSLLYRPHKSWYSWSINSLVNGVYAFGFLFMLPQLFVNYKLKSVAHLPWKAFMYKAFNTFIDDVFAFIITMPVAHRVACFRDDIVFLIYLYQRWLYPVDKSRKDTMTISEDMSSTIEENTTDKKEN
ncbi:cleft lip and palate transmembrane protein 1-like protein isoform X1 [Chelonus insularis]|uniref:cleft lip and palate transmembrane protein 1-like protein isoform X1 n=1 Tax=Chelonus insularis TaxID=460826 RepID=UPI00158D559B|nr:cleft lip and palate transmembrane protein 1-like protein isoform X1 [Chelonus insularis]